MFTTTWHNDLCLLSLPRSLLSSPIKFTLKFQFLFLILLLKHVRLFVPLPLWHFGHPQKVCGCAPAVVTRYKKRIYGPLLDRIDIHIQAPSVDYEKLSSDRLAETSESLRKRVQATRDLRNKRFSLFAMQICMSGRSGNFASCRTKAAC